MNVKKNVRKVFAMATGVALMGATMAGALAYDLSDYPQPFVDEEGVFNGAIVVGASAATADVVGAIDIAANLQAHATKDVEFEGSEVVTVEGGEDEEVFLNVEAGKEYSDRDLEGFQDSDVEVDGEDYDFEEFFNLNDKVKVATSALSNYQEELNYGDEAYMEITQGAGYYIKFDGDGVDTTDEFDIDFLGRSITVLGSDTDSIDIETSSEYYMEEGDSVEVDGHEVTLRKVGEGSVLVDVDGQVLAVEDEEEFDDADDFTVRVESSFYIEGDDDNSATLTLGSDIKETYHDGEALEIFGGSDDDDEATWVWDIDSNNTHIRQLGAKLNMDFVKSEAEDAEDRAALAMGEEFELPNNYASLSFVGWEGNAMDKFEELNIAMEREDLTDATGDEYVISFTSSYEDAFILDNGNIEADEVYMWYNDVDTSDDLSDGDQIQVWYDDGDDTFNYKNYTYADATPPSWDAFDAFEFELGDKTTIDMSDDYHNLTLAFGTDDVVELDVQYAVDNALFDRFGDDENTAESTDFIYTYDGGEKVNGKDDEDRKGSYGMYWSDIESQLDSDEISLNVPYEQQKAKFVVTSKASSVSSGSEGGMYEEVQPIGVGLGMLDTDAGASLGDKSMIVVGGPSVNTVAMELMGNPTSEQIQETFTEGKAMIKWYDDQMAMLVAGWGADDTHHAAQVLVSRADELSGDEVEVSVVGDVQDAEINLVE